MVFGGYTYGSQALSFLASIIIARLLLPADFGFVALITVFTGFISIFTDAGMSFVIIRSDYGRTFQRAVNNLAFWMGICLFLLMSLLAYPIALFYGDLNLILPTILLSSLFVIRSLSIVPSAILSKAMEFNFLGKRRLIVNVITNLLIIFLALIGFRYWALIIPQILTAFLNYLLIDLKVKLGFRIYPFHYTKAAFRRTKSLMSNLTGFNLINYWARNADNLLVGKLYSAADLGIYSRAYSLLTLPLNSISGLFGGILFPSLKKLKSSGGNVNHEYGNVLGVISMLNFPIAALMVLFARPLVLLLWGENWLPVADILPYFGLLILSQTLISTSGNIYILLGKERVNFWIGSSTAIAMVVFIAAGAYFSVVDVARFYAFGFLTVSMPVNLYFGFYRTMGFSSRFMWSFWMPKVLISLFLFFSILWGTVYLSGILFGLLLIHIGYLQRHEFSKLLSWVFMKLSHLRSN
jgi:teichuronic acid exporter